MTDRVSDLRRVRVVVSGRVQGVWFRGSTQQRALELGLTGWVRNLPDGRVEALFEGDSEAVEAAIAFVRVGPRMARVRELQLDEQPTASPQNDFRVR